MKFYHRDIPDTDIMGNPLSIGDKVVVFNEHFISWDNCEVIEAVYHEDEGIRRGIKVDDDGMKFFGLGTHEILKIT